MGLVRPPIVFYAFDLLRLNGQDLRSWPIEQRKANDRSAEKTAPGYPLFGFFDRKYRRASE
jgi:hypothetical protein